MSSQIDTNFRSFLVSTGSSGISAYLAVAIQSDGTITPANAASGFPGHGILQEDVPAGYYGRVKLWTGAGTFLAQASGTAITPGTQYTVITGGFAGVTASGNTTPWLVALGSAVASNGIVAEFAYI
jgi:hypothetical protein